MPNFINSRTFYVTASAVALGAAVGAFIYRGRIFRKRGYSLKLPQVFVVNSTEEWMKVADKIKAACSEKQVLGLDCEWRPQRIKGDTGAHPVALLQIATVHSCCILIRLNKLGRNIPDDLKLLLKDKSILKVGVAVNDDSRKLMNDYGLLVEGCLDLRHLVDRVPKYARLERKGLKALGESVAGVRMRKPANVRTSNWEADELSPEQIKYAAEDAVVSAVIFNHLMNDLLLSWPERLIHRQLAPEKLHMEVLNLVGHLVDHRYRASVSPAKSLQNKLNGGQSAFPGKQQTRAYSVRKTPLYHNSQLQAPDGEVLCTCDTRKAIWYLDRGLGEMVSEEPLIVRLKFEPTSRPILDNKYYIEQKENKCVVCGRQDSLVRKIIVPHEYRKFFPPLMKQHLSHDVLLLCLECHLLSNRNDVLLRQEFALECGAPLGSGPVSRAKEDPELRRVKSAGRALLNFSHQLPDARKVELTNILMEFYQVSDISESLLNVAAEIDTMVENTNFILHGKKVVEYVSSHGGLLAFEIRWRKHFLDTMRPRFLPKLWSIDHNHQRLAMQVAENEYNFDVKVLGPLPPVNASNQP